MIKKLSPVLWTRDLKQTIALYEAGLGFIGKAIFGSIYIATDQVDKLWDAVKDKATVKTSLNDRKYGMRDFSTLNNNGYELVFGQDISNGK